MHPDEVDAHEGFQKIDPSSPLLPWQQQRDGGAADDSDEKDDDVEDDPVVFPLETPCIKDGRDSDDEDDPPWTNWELHEDRALDSSDSSSYS
ncbi:hypothetical protein PG994_000994 [Apiospora phragmitis]|uniref:Uncharacterized protein n=1 Tax=Apiospora phragmitis TaxID=2905665 RepID=A0ABR1WR74_9PEZI